MSSLNVYNDARRADAYATLEFPGTYWLAFRDLPEIIARHVTGPVALDFGCGAGRFLATWEPGPEGMQAAAVQQSRERAPFSPTHDPRAR